MTCDGVGNSGRCTPGVPRTPGLPGSNGCVGYRPRRCSAITSSSIPEFHRGASGTKKAFHLLYTRCATPVATLASLFRRGLPHRSTAITASVRYRLYFGPSRSPVFRCSLSHHQRTYIHRYALHKSTKPRSIAQPARCTTFVFFGLEMFPAKNRRP